MKTLLYPKFYATYLGKFYRGEVVQHSRKKESSAYTQACSYRFRLNDGEVIEGRHFSRSGSTPRSVKREWYDDVKRFGYRKALVLHNIMPIGTRVKLYRRNNSWHYRHIGQ